MVRKLLAAVERLPAAAVEVLVARVGIVRHRGASAARTNVPSAATLPARGRHDLGSADLRLPEDPA